MPKRIIQMRENGVVTPVKIGTKIDYNGTSSEVIGLNLTEVQIKTYGEELFWVPRGDPYIKVIE